jgi:acetyl-CoA carboxylase biotin carboxylase subunit
LQAAGEVRDMFRSLLVANRGEIALRVIRTARRLGIETVAVYSDADADALHVACADKAVRIGPPPPSESYLNGLAIIEAAKRTGASAVHPGYGFLSENAEFAEACAASDLTFIGPPAAAIRAMGAKDLAKALMQKAGVAVVPGYLGEVQDGKVLAAQARRIGFPVLIKAIAGGGGKGMRRVDAAADFAAALESARREAQAAFGNDRVLIEKYIRQPRHIEMQVFADAHGNVVHLFERDCSVQRRHQKIIEEAPAPGLPPAMRATMEEAAVRATRAVEYVGAGTIEFIADASQGLQGDKCWFLEMNTRLQVEHPVTEAITGLDLVEWQLRVAAGEALPKTQDEIRVQGHAIEARLYAEDPQADFLPSTGTLERLRLPTEVRVDSGFREGDVISVFYDPLIAKVIAYDPTRAGAAATLSGALSKTEIAGVRTNNGLLVRILRDEHFLSGDVDTSFLERRRKELFADVANPPAAVFASAAKFIVHERTGRAQESAQPGDPWDVRDSFRLGGPAHTSIDFLVNGKRVTVHESNDRSAASTSAVMRLMSGEIAVIDQGQTYTFREYDPLAFAEGSVEVGDRVLVPMPGKILQILVKPGDLVARSQPLAVLEAMKMEHTLLAPGEAEVESVEFSPGDQVKEGAVIVRFRTREPLQ